MRRLLVAGAALLLCCAVTPLTNKLHPGEEPLVIAVGEGPDGYTDLFAAGPGGGPFVRFTFNRPIERLPAISPSGTRVAFLRSAAAGALAELAVYDLETGAEWRTPLPSEAGAGDRVGWSRGGERVYVRSGERLYASPAPPAALVLTAASAASRAEADSATTALLGDPPFGRVARCGGAVCVVTPGGDTTRLGSTVVEAAPWGTDSLALVLDGAVEIRPLGSGRPRRPLWTGRPAGLRNLVYHPGSGPLPAR